MLAELIKLFVLMICIPIGYFFSVMSGLIVSVMLKNAQLGYYVTVICAVCITLFVIVESLITLYAMVKSVWA
jgi:hypothetical protein